MRITQFDTPGNNGDLVASVKLARNWSDQLSSNFDQGVQRVQAKLAGHSGAVSQYYNPVTHGSAAPDLALPSGVITWNGFPRKFLGASPGVPPNFSGAEPAIVAGQTRPQDEYLEWHVIRTNGKITSVQFTSEGYDYYQFLGANAPDILLGLYRKFIDPSIQLADLMTNGEYDISNKWNTESGAMHLTQSANNLFAEVILGADATVRRKDNQGHEVTSAIPLTRCSQFGDPQRNSDPAIGAGVNGLARQGRMVTLADPVGLYIDNLDDSGFRLPNGDSTTGWFKRLRGSDGHTIRAVFEPPDGSPFTVSNVTIGDTAIIFGGQIAQHITMKLVGVASVSTSIHNPLIACEGASAHLVGGAASFAERAAQPTLPLRGSF